MLLHATERWDKVRNPLSDEHRECYHMLLVSLQNITDGLSALVETIKEEELSDLIIEQKMTTP